MRPKAVVTGGCGFIGSHIVELLIEKNFKVAVIDNLSSGEMENLSKVRDEVELVIGDVRDEKLLNNICKDAKVIFHQAAMVSVPESEKNPSECFDVNVNGTIKVIKSAIKNNISRVVFASSCAVYGNPSIVPIKEDSKLNPLSPYALSKVIGEKMLKEVSEKTNLTTVALRYFNVFGPRQNSKSKYSAVISKFLEDGINRKVLSIEGSGNQTRDFVFVKDVAMANYLCAMKEIRGFDIFNVCSNKEISILELANYFSQEIEGTVLEFKKGRKNEIMRSVGDRKKAKKVLGFSPQNDFKEAIKKTMDYYLERMQNVR
jgi:UDP-glucose 4-epimerase